MGKSKRNYRYRLEVWFTTDYPLDGNEENVIVEEVAGLLSTNCDTLVDVDVDNDISIVHFGENVD